MARRGSCTACDGANRELAALVNHDSSSVPSDMLILEDTVGVALRALTVA